MPESFSALQSVCPSAGKKRSRSGKAPVSFHLPFQEKLVLFLVGKGYDFGFYTGAIAGPYALNLPVERGESGSPSRRMRCVSSLVKQVQHGSCFRWRTPLFIMRIYGSRFPFLNLHIFNARSVRRCVQGFPVFIRPYGDAVPGDGFGQLIRCGFCHAPARSMVRPTCISPFRKVPAVSTTHLARKVTPNGGESGYLAVFNEGFPVRCPARCAGWEYSPESRAMSDEFVAVTLCARTPHGGGLWSGSICGTG